MAILRIKDVLTETGHRSHASIYVAIKAGLFPSSIRIGTRAVGWPAEEVKAINNARIAGKTDVEIRALVVLLHARRVDPLIQ